MDRNWPSRSVTIENVNSQSGHQSTRISNTTSRDLPGTQLSFSIRTLLLVSLLVAVSLGFPAASVFAFSFFPIYKYLVRRRDHIRNQPLFCRIAIVAALLIPPYALSIGPTQMWIGYLSANGRKQSLNRVIAWRDSFYVPVCEISDDGAWDYLWGHYTYRWYRAGDRMVLSSEPFTDTEDSEER